ncbi:MAG: phosphate acyltransferase PlsX [Armatimonadaceae bacterium]
MGGDHAPTEVVRGALDYIAEYPTGQVLLVGQPDALERVLEAEGATISDRLHIIPTTQVIEMDEHPMEAFRGKPDSSLVVCNRLVRQGDAEASFSAGNTGAMMVAATLVLELLEGVRRAGIATVIPAENGGGAVLVDAGANVDCRAKHLEHFALLGSVYTERVLGVKSPRVGLLSNGEEEAKGNELTKETHRLLKALGARIHYIGNVEGNHLTEGKVDVVVCDGFVGNVLLKAAEGMGRLAISLLVQAANEEQDPEKVAQIRQLIAKFRARMDYSEYGGAPLLGVNGVAMIAHGRSDRRAICNGIRQAVRAVEADYLTGVRDAVRKLPSAQEEA